MKHDLKKATLIPAVAAKNRDAANLTRHFHGGGGGHLPRKAVWHPSLTKLVIIFMWFDKGHVVINSLIIIWISNVANSRNVDLTEKQHSRHQQFWRFPLSPLEAGGRLPRSRDHIFSYSMSKASPPQGPDMWYLTFYENKVPIYQTTIANSLFQNLTLATFVRNCGAKPNYKPRFHGKSRIEIFDA